MGLFALFVVPFVALGYALGRLLISRQLHFPFPVAAVGSVIFWTLTPFMVLRTGMHLMMHPERMPAIIFDLVSTYADVTVFTLGLMRGYRVSPRGKTKSIKSGLAVAPDGGLHLVDPFTDPADAAFFEE